MAAAASVPDSAAAAAVAAAGQISVGTVVFSESTVAVAEESSVSVQTKKERTSKMQKDGNMRQT